MVKIGGVSLDVSHPLGFATRLEENCMALRYEYVWDKGFRKPEEVDWFVKRFGLTGKVDDISEMVDNVDVGFIQACNWEKHLDLAMPFINKGKPVFIDKPIVGSVSDITRLRELVKNGAKIMGSSSARYAEEVQKFLSEPVETRGEVVSIYGTCGIDEFNYGVHIVEILSELAGAKAVACKYVGTAKNGENDPVEIYNIRYENGVCGTYHCMHGRHQLFYITIMTTKGIRNFCIDSSKIYISLLKEIYRELGTGRSKLADIEKLINCVEIMLCGKKSRDEVSGAEVHISELGSDDKFDGYKFEAEYGAKAAVIYKD